MKPRPPSRPDPAYSRTPLLARLDEAIAALRDPLDIACAQAERAALLARHGYVPQARREIETLRELQRRHGNLRLSAWLSLADGLADYFENLALDARAKVDRAWRDSAAARLPELHAQAAAWLAHLDSVNLDFTAMARHASQALHLATADDHATRARASLVIADAYHYADRAARAQPWYRAARHHAATIGDETTLSALMHNRAQIAGHLAREQSLFGRPDPDIARQVLMAAESALHFDAGVGTASLNALVPALRAQLLVLLDRHREAVTLFARCLDQALAEGQHRIEAAFRSDLAWACLRLGDVDAAREQARRAEAALDERCPVDEQALSHQRLAHVAGELGEPERAEAHRHAAAAAHAVYVRQREDIVRALDPALTGLQPAG